MCSCLIYSSWNCSIYFFCFQSGFPAAEWFSSHCRLELEKKNSEVARGHYFHIVWNNESITCQPAENKMSHAPAKGRRWSEVAQRRPGNDLTGQTECTKKGQQMSSKACSCLGDETSKAPFVLTLSKVTSQPDFHLLKPFPSWSLYPKDVAAQ